MSDAPGISSPLNLAIVEDEGLFRDLLRCSLSLLSGIQVMAAYGDADTAAEELPSLAIDVLILDIDLGNGRNGIELGIAMRKVWPQVGIVLLSNHRDPAYFTAIPQAEVRGWSYLLKKSVSDLAALDRAIRGVADGMVVLDPQIVESLATRPMPLSERNRAVLGLLAEGYSNSAIAEKLCVTEKTVENQVSSLYRQLGIETANPSVHPRVQAALHYLKQAL